MSISDPCCIPPAVIKARDAEGCVGSRCLLLVYLWNIRNTCNLLQGVVSHTLMEARKFQAMAALASWESRRMDGLVPLERAASQAPQSSHLGLSPKALGQEEATLLWEGLCFYVTFHRLDESHPALQSAICFSLTNTPQSHTNTLNQEPHWNRM